MAPNSVSGRVVKTETASGSPASCPTMGKRISAPSLRPIQFSCALRVVSDQSMCFRFSSSLPAYWVILKNHWLRNLISTAVPQRSHSPPTTCSLASTVLQLGHQLTAASFFSASPPL